MTPLTFRRQLFICALAAIALITTKLPDQAALADGHEADTTDERLRATLAGEHRSEKNKARDIYRHPYETLTFFGLKEDMTVMEINATGGWYTEVIAPVVAEEGQYISTMWDGSFSEGSQRMFDQLVGVIDDNRAIMGEAKVVGIGKDGNYEPVPPGSVDLVVTFRNIHNWMASDAIENMLGMMYTAAKPGGHLGIVEHRGNPMVKQDPKSIHGYVNEGYTIKLAEEAGWQLVATSDVNNNPMDDKDYAKRVWRLPPTLRYLEFEGWPEVDAEQRAKSLAIGESDRFTLLFVKPVE